MCKFSYVDRKGEHQCPFPQIIEYLKRKDPEAIANYTLPIDKEGFCIFHSNDLRWKHENKFMEQFSILHNILTDSTDINQYEYIGFVFVGSATEAPQQKEIDFSKFQFTKEVNFERSTFIDFVRFENNDLTNGVDFTKCKFNDKFLLKNSVIGLAVFSDAIFSMDARFNDSQFSRMIADFYGTEFKKSVFFDNADFNIMTVFDEAKFNTSNGKENCARFSKVNFKDSLNFKGASFSCIVRISDCNFDCHAEFIDTSFNATKSTARFVEADISFSNITLGDSANIIFESTNIDAPLFDTDVDFQFATPVKGLMRFINVNFQRIGKKSRDTLLKLEKIGNVEIGAGCIKYRYQTEIKEISIDKECHDLILTMTQVFSNYFSVQNGTNLGVEIVDRSQNTIRYFYFSDENIEEDIFYDRLQQTEKQLWNLLQTGHHNPHSGQLTPIEQEKTINSVDTYAGLFRVFMGVGVRALLGRWTKNKTTALIDSVNFNQQQPAVTHVTVNNIINQYQQKTMLAFNSRQSISTDKKL